MKTLLLCFVVILLCASASFGVINVHSDGSDGVFNPTASVEVDLSQAVTGTWDQVGNGSGVYDPDKWAVVFKYSSVNIPSGVAVTFKNHPSGAPVVWLVQGNAAIAGTVNLDGKSTYSVGGRMREPGSGGFRGGSKSDTSQPAQQGGAGLGPGGGMASGACGSYGSSGGAGSGPTYGNAGVVPLLGGSGGAAYLNTNAAAGGGGGGGFLLAAGDTIALGGTVRACGFAGVVGAGSGGGIRLIADNLLGGGTLLATGGASGRIRVEVNQGDWAFISSPVFAYGPPGAVPQIWPPADGPRVRIVSLGGLAVPGDPRAGVTFPTTDVYLGGSGGAYSLVIQADNVPLTWHVKARATPINGSPATLVDASYVSGDATLSTWQADLTLGQYYTAIQVRASLN